MNIMMKAKLKSVYKNWFTHNVIGHGIGLGFVQYVWPSLATRIHDSTLPEDSGWRVRKAFQANDEDPNRLTLKADSKELEVVKSLEDEVLALEANERRLKEEFATLKAKSDEQEQYIVNLPTTHGLESEIKDYKLKVELLKVEIGDLKEDLKIRHYEISK